MKFGFLDNSLFYLFPAVIGITIIITIGMIVYQKLEHEFAMWLREILGCKKASSFDNAKLYRQPIMTKAESSFYDFLKSIVGENYLIETRKPLTEVFKRNGSLSHELWTMHSRGHVDFLIVESHTKNPLLAIELDDWTHNTPSRRDADRRKDILFQRADLKLLRFRVGKRWGTDEELTIKNSLPATKG